MKKEISTYLDDDSFCCPLGSLTLLIKKIGKIFRNHLANLNVTNSQASIFLILLKEGELSQSQLGKALDLERSTVCRDLSRLLKQSYLYKIKDGKSPLIGLTKKGQELATEIFVEWQKGYDESRIILGDDGLEALKKLKSKLL